MLAVVAPRRSGYLPRRYEDRAGQTRAGASLAEHSCSLSSRQLWSFCPVFRPARGLRLQNRSGLASRQDLLLRALQSRTCKASLRLAKRPKKSMSAGTLTGVSNTLISWLVSLIRDAQSKKQEHKPRTHQTLAASLKATGGLGVVTVLLIARCTTWHTPKSRV